MPSYWQRVDAATQTRLDEWADLLVAGREAYFQLAESSHWEPSPQSRASIDATSIAEIDPEPPAGYPASHGSRLFNEAVSSFLTVAAGHLGGMAALCRSAEVLFSAPMLTRAILENTAHAMWIVGDGGDSALDRLARTYLEELLSLEEAKKNAGRLRNKQDPVYIEAAERFRVIRAHVLSRFPGATVSELGKRSLGGQQLLGPEATVEWMYCLMHRAGASSVNPREAVGIYGLLSNLTHPTIYPVRESREWVSDPGHQGHAFSVYRVDADFLEREVRVCIVAMFQALSYVASYFGWDRGPIERLIDEITRSLPETLD